MFEIALFFCLIFLNQDFQDERIGRILDCVRRCIGYSLKNTRIFPGNPKILQILIQKKAEKKSDIALE